MKITGTCHCGAVTYEAEMNPERFGICHCTDCQLMSGSDYRTIAIVPAESFRLTGAAPVDYVKTADSGSKRRITFCGTCGAGIYAAPAEETPTVYNLRAGTINERRSLTPRYEIWCSSAMPWLERFEGTARYDKGFT
ncbi:MAG: GFA family protein [Roseovarius sp.]